MASSGKKRKREFQDENLFAAENLHCIQTKSEAKKRKVSIKSKQSSRKLFEDGSLTSQINKELHSSKKFMVLRSATKDLTSPIPATTVTSSSKLSTTGTFQRRASLVKLKKPLTTLTGTLKTKLAEQVKKSRMKGQQDYSQPISAVDSSLDHLRFMSALHKQVNPGQVPEQDKKLEQQIDHEIRMRDGTAKLLAASRNPNQLLEAAKNLHTSNARMLAYMSELQRRKTNEVLQREDPSDGNQVPCKAKVSLSDLRIPLLWKEAEHFKNKGDHRRYAVFCLVKIGTDIYDTTLQKNIDRTSTDLTFDDVITFDNVQRDFECQLEVYCHRCQDDLSVASTPKRIKKKIEDFGNSVGRSVGKRLSGLKYDSDNSTIIGPKFDCIASATLKLADVDDCVGIFNLTLETDSAFTDLPLFGNFCCRLVAQPHCLIEDTISGQMYFQDPESLDWDLYTCHLRNLSISCWKEKPHSGSPDVTIPVTKTTQVSEVPASLCKREHCIQIIGDGSRYNLAAPDVETKKKWWDAIYQHLLDQVMWLQACERLMEIRIATPRRHSAYGKGMFSSLYDSVDDPASPMTRVLNRLNIPECAEEDETQPENCKTKMKLFTEKTEQSTSSNEMETEVSSDNQAISAGATVAAASDTSSTDEDSLHSGSEKGDDTPSDTCSAASATGAIGGSSDELVVEQQRQVCADAGEASTTVPEKEQSGATVPEGKGLKDQEDECTRKDELESPEVPPHGAEPENAEPSGELLEQPDEYSKENVAENSWFQMMRQNEDEDADIIMEEEGNAHKVVDEETGKVDDEPCGAVEDSVMESLADLDVSSECGMELLQDSIPGYAMEELHGLDKAEDVGNESRLKSTEVEVNPDSTSDDLCERNAVLDTENANSEIKESHAEYENDAKSEGDEAEPGQSGRKTSEHADDGKCVDEDTESDEAENQSEMDNESVGDEVTGSKLGKRGKDDKTSEEQEDADCADFKSNDEVGNVCETENPSGKDDDLENENRSRSQMDLVAENGGVKQPETVLEAVLHGEDTDQSQCGAQSDSQSEIDQHSHSQSEIVCEGNESSSDEGHLQEGADNDDDKETGVPNEGNVNENVKDNLSQSKNVSENTENSDASNDMPNQPVALKEANETLEVNETNSSEKVTEKEVNSDDNQNTSSLTEEQKPKGSTADDDPDNADSNTKCRLSRSLSKETSV